MVSQASIPLQFTFEQSHFQTSLVLTKPPNSKHTVNPDMNWRQPDLERKLTRAIFRTQD